MRYVLALALSLMALGAANAGSYGGRSVNSNGFHGSYGNQVFVSPSFFVSPTYFLPSYNFVPSGTYVLPAYGASYAPGLVASVAPTYGAAAVTYSVTPATAAYYGYPGPFTVVYNNGNFYHGSTGQVLTGQFATYMQSVHASRGHR